MIDLGTTNGSRYYSVADDAALTLPNSDWSVLAGIRYRLDTTNPQYILSTNNFNAAGSLNILAAAGTGYINVALNLYPAIWAEPAPSDGQHIIAYACRRSGNLYAGWIGIGQSAVNESAGQAVSEFSNGLGLIFGGRYDLDTGRHFRGGMHFVSILPSHGITQSELVRIANGLPLLNSSAVNSSNAMLWDLRSSDDATIPDLFTGRVATRNGTGYGTNITEQLIIYPTDPITNTEIAGAPVGTTKGIRVTLYSKAGLPRANLSDLKIAFFDQSSVDTLATPIFTTAIGTTNGSGLCEVDVDSTTTLNIGQRGTIIICIPHVSDYKLNQYFISEAEIVNIA